MYNFIYIKKCLKQFAPLYHLIPSSVELSFWEEFSSAFYRPFCRVIK